MKMRKRNGFTLIELLLVLVILAALATVVVPKFTRRGEQAKVTAASTTIANLETSLDAFEMDNDRFPTNSEGLKALVIKPSNADGWKQPYIKSVSKDPWGNEYIYKYPGQYNKYSFDLSSAGPDGQTGNDDDIKNWTEEKY